MAVSVMLECVIALTCLCGKHWLTLFLLDDRNLMNLGMSLFTRCSRTGKQKDGMMG